MISTSDQTVIVRIPVEAVKIRFAGAERTVLQLAQAFTLAEYADGNVFPISCPLEEWILSTIVNSGVTPGTGDIGQRVYFQFEAPGERSNDGQDNKETSVTNIQTGL